MPRLCIKIDSLLLQQQNQLKETELLFQGQGWKISGLVKLGFIKSVVLCITGWLNSDHVITDPGLLYLAVNF